MAINWSDIYSRKVRDAFRYALSDKNLTHEEVVDILHTLLKDGELTGVEMNDLHKIAATAESMPVHSRQMLQILGKEVLNHLSYSPFYFSTDRQKYALEIICDFLKRRGPQSFSGLDRDRVGIDLLLRVSNPNIINQRNATICGPVSFLYGVAFDSPAAYARFGIDLFEKGRAKIGRVDVSPSSDCRSYTPPAPLSHGEWVTAASLRDSENFFFDYDSVDASGGSQTSEMAKWFSKAGYTDIHWDKNRFTSREAGDIALINKFYNAGYRVALSVNSKMLKAKLQTETSWKSNHLVILRSPISVANDMVQLTIFTWGQGQYKVPQGKPMTKGQFLEHWYGYVAAKPF